MEVGWAITEQKLNSSPYDFGKGGPTSPFLSRIKWEGLLLKKVQMENGFLPQCLGVYTVWEDEG